MLQTVCHMRTYHALHKLSCVSGTKQYDGFFVDVTTPANTLMLWVLITTAWQPHLNLLAA